MKKNLGFLETLGEVYIGVGATCVVLYVIGGAFALIPNRDVWMLLMIGLAWFGPAAIVFGIIEKVREWRDPV